MTDANIIYHRVSGECEPLFVPAIGYADCALPALRYAAYAAGAVVLCAMLMIAGVRWLTGVKLR